MTLQDVKLVLAEARPASFFRVKPVGMRAFWAYRCSMSVGGVLTFIECNAQGETPATRLHMFVGLPADFESVRLAEEDRKYGGLRVAGRAKANT